MTSPNEYQLAANKFCSPSWHGDTIHRGNIADLLDVVVQESEEVDKYKRALFYGERKHKDLVTTSSFDLPASSDHDLVHAVLGLVTEAGELAKTLVTSFDQLADDETDPSHPATTLTVDTKNLKEEGGDILWYVALLCRAIGVPMEQMMAANIAKLDMRFNKKKFDATLAVNRDLDAEAKALD